MARSFRVTKRDCARWKRPGRSGQGPQLAVRQVAGPGHHLEGHLADARRGLDREGQRGALAGLDREAPATGLALGQAELGEQVVSALGVEDLEVEAAGERHLAAVVDHYLDRRLVALAQEAGQVGAHHEILHRRRLLGERAGPEVLGQGVHPHVPLGDRVRHREFERHRAVRAGQQVRIPEGGFGKVAPQLHCRGRRRRGGRWNRAGGRVERCFRRLRDHSGGYRAFASHHDLLRDLHRLHHARVRHAHGSGEPPPTGAADAVAVEELEPVRRRPREVGQHAQALALPPDDRAAAQAGTHAERHHRPRVERERVCRLVGGEEVQAAVVHVGQHLGRAGRLHLLVLAAHRHPPGLLAAGPQAVAEAGELDCELAVVPGHEHGGLFGEQLVVPHAGETDGQAAAIPVGDRDLENAGAVFRGDLAPLQACGAAEDLEGQRLAVQAGVEEEARRAAHRHRRGLGGHHQRQGERGRGLAGHHQLAAGLEAGAEGVGGLVAQAVGAGRQAGELDLGLAGGSVLERATLQLGAVAPQAERRLGRQAPVPPRAQPVARGLVALFALSLGRRGGERLLGRELRLRRLRQGQEPPGPRAGQRLAVEVGALDGDHCRLVGAHETGIGRERGLDGHEADPEDTFGRARLAAFVGHVHGQGIAIGESRRRRFALVGLGGEGEVELAFGVQSFATGRDHLRRAGGAAPPPPRGILRHPRHPPGDLAGGDRKPEVVAHRAGERRRPVDAERRRGVVDRGLERRALVLLDLDPRSAADRGADRPAAEQAAGRDAEAPGGRAVGVAGHRGARHHLAVGVGELHLELLLGLDLEALAVAPRAVGHHFPQHFLLGPVDAAVGVDQSVTPVLRPVERVEAEALEVGGLVRALAGEEDVAAVFANRAAGEGHAAVGGGGPRLDHAMVTLPVQDVEGDLGGGDRRAGRSGAHRHLVALERLPGDQHQVAHDYIHGREQVAGGDEVLPAGGDYHPQAGLGERRNQVGGVAAQVRGGRQLGHPLAVGPAAADDLRHLAVGRQQVVVLAGIEGLLQVQAVGAEVELAEVGVPHLDRPAAAAVDRHGSEVVGRGLELGHDRRAALATDRVGVGLGPGAGGRAGVHQRVGTVLLPQPARQRRLPPRPPLEAAAERGRVLGEVLLEPFPVFFAGEGGRQVPQARQAGLERGLRLAPAAVPGLEVGEDGGDLRQRMGLRRSEVVLRRERRRAEELFEVEPVHAVVVLRPPLGGVGEELDPEVADRVAQRAADARRVIVLLDVLGEPADRLLSPRGAVLPHREVSLLGRAEDLLPGPGLEVDGLRALHPLALADLPAVGLEVEDQRLAVEQVQDRAVERLFGPGLLFVGAHRGLEAAERGLELHLADEGPGPALLVPGLAGGIADLRHALGRLLHLLLGDQAIDLLPLGPRRAGFWSHGTPLGGFSGCGHGSGRRRSGPVAGGGDRQDQQQGGGGDEEAEGRGSGMHSGRLDLAATQKETAAPGAQRNPRAMATPG